MNIYHMLGAVQSTLCEITVVYQHKQPLSQLMDYKTKFEPSFV